jgi:hypothetical protein
VARTAVTLPLPHCCITCVASISQSATPIVGKPATKCKAFRIKEEDSYKHDRLLFNSILRIPAELRLFVSGAKHINNGPEAVNLALHQKLHTPSLHPCHGCVDLKASALRRHGEAKQNRLAAYVQRLHTSWVLARPTQTLNVFVSENELRKVRILLSPPKAGSAGCVAPSRLQ